VEDVHSRARGRHGGQLSDHFAVLRNVPFSFATASSVG
jgi:hypothetical protein